MARVQQLLQEWKPWLKGHGVVLTPHRDVEDKHPVNYDVAEIGAQGIGDISGVTYPWVLGVDIEEGHLQLGQALRWVVDHVARTDVVIIDVPRSRHEPSEIVDMFRLAWDYPWIISAEINGDRTTVVASDRAMIGGTFLIDNRPEIGDTFSCLPLVKALKHEYPNLTVAMRHDPHGLVEDAIPYDAECAYLGIVRQQTDRNEYGDFYRRSLDFYEYPMQLARDLGYLRETPPGPPKLPDLRFTSKDTGAWSVVKTGLKKDAHPVVIATNTNFARRDWPIDRWSKVINWLVSEHHQVVLVGSEKIPIPGMPKVGRRKLQDMRGKTTVREMAHIVSHAKLVLCPDTSVAHFAQAYDVPVMILQGPTAGAPLFRYSDRVISVTRRDNGCVNCFQRCDPEKKYREGKQEPLYTCGPRGDSVECMNRISVVSVLDRICEHLGMHVEPVGLSVCIMAKNEEEVIKDCISSVEDVADEIIFVDTGSTDRTLEVVREADTRGIVKTFVDDQTGFERGVICDYAAARNGTFRRATRKYVMWLDAGDRLENGEHLRKILEEQQADVIQMQTIFGEDKYFRERVVPRGLAWWADRVHETIDIGTLSCSGTTKCAVRHIVTKKVGREGSLERNIRLLKRMIKENKETNPRYGRWNYYLARELDHSGQREESIPYYEVAAQTCRFWEEQLHSIISLARIRLDRRECHAALGLAYDALKVGDGWREPYYIAGDAYFWMGEYERAIPWYLHCTQVPRPHTILWVWEDLYSWLPYCQLSYCFERVGKLKEAVEFAQRDLEHSPHEQRRRAKDHLDDLVRKMGGQ